MGVSVGFLCVCDGVERVIVCLCVIVCAKVCLCDYVYVLCVFVSL